MPATVRRPTVSERQRPLSQIPERRPNVATNLADRGIMFERLPTKFPDCDPKHLDALAAVWAREAGLVIARMFEIYGDTEVMRLPIEVRHEAVFELAKLTLWLEDRMIEKKTAAVPIDQISPATEAKFITNPVGVERIDNTARIMAERIWKPLCSQWWKRYPAIPAAPKNTVVRGVPSNSQGVKKQHFSPVFSNRRWAGTDGRVSVYALGVDGRIVVRQTGYRNWGRESFIYSQALERHFGLIEGDAETPYRKLLEVVPFSETDRRHWVAFLAALMFRTPFFLVQSLAGLRDMIETRGISYPADVASLRRAHETMFTNPDVFTMVYRLVVDRRWEIWKAPSGSQFVRSDHPVVISTNGTQTTMFYALSPDRCFVAGPALAEGPPQIVPDGRAVTDAQRADVNRLMASFARKSVIASPQVNDIALRAELEPMLGQRWLAVSRAKRFLPEHWGDLV